MARGTDVTQSRRGSRLKEFHTKSPSMRSPDFGQNQRKNFKMKSRDNISTSGPIPFPANSRDKTAPVTEEDRAVAREHDTEIHELCRGTTFALQELRHGIANVLLDTLE